MCSKCGENHKIEDCTSSVTFCINCEGNHQSSDKKCPEFLNQKEILRIKYTENISFPEAKKRIEQQRPQRATYAQTVVGNIPSTAAANVTSTSKVETAVEVQTFLTWSVRDDAFKWLGCSPEAEELPLQLTVKPSDEKESRDASALFAKEQRSRQARKKTHQISKYGNTGIPKPNDKHRKERTRSPISVP